MGFDLAHAVGNIPLRLHDWGPDFAVWCNYKYLNGGPGCVGGCFVHQRHARAWDVPRFAGWWGHDEKTRFRMGPEFDPMEGAEGWQPSNPPILALAAIARIARHLLRSWHGTTAGEKRVAHRIYGISSAREEIVQILHAYAGGAQPKGALNFRFEFRSRARTLRQVGGAGNHRRLARARHISRRARAAIQLIPRRISICRAFLIPSCLTSPASTKHVFGLPQ